jgi:hypothetical protein
LTDTGGFFSFLTSVVSKADNLAVLVLLAVCGALIWLHVVWRREEREDRRALLELINKNTEALNGVRMALIAITGKPLP